jgi:hypothetical protein
MMVRSMDFTVEPGQTYRYRTRLVFWSERQMELPGRWSEPSESVTVR